MTQDDDSTEPMTVDMIVKISLDPQGMHEIFNLTLHVGHPWGRSFTSLIASLPQFDRPELVVSFPPDGYEFGINTSPFVMCYVQVTHQPCTFPETNYGHTRHLTSSLFPRARSALSPAILNPKPLCFEHRPHSFLKINQNLLLRTFYRRRAIRTCALLPCIFSFEASVWAMEQSKQELRGYP